MESDAEETGPLMSMIPEQPIVIETERVYLTALAVKCHKILNTTKV